MEITIYNVSISVSNLWQKVLVLAQRNTHGKCLLKETLKILSGNSQEGIIKLLTKKWRNITETERKYIENIYGSYWEIIRRQLINYLQIIRKPSENTSKTIRKPIRNGQEHWLRKKNIIRK